MVSASFVSGTFLVVLVATALTISLTLNTDTETKSPVLLKIVTQNTTLNLFAGPATNTHLENITQYDAIPYRIWACVGATPTGVGDAVSAVHRCQLMFQSNTTKSTDYTASAASLAETSPDWHNFVSAADRARLETNTSLDSYKYGYGEDKALHWIVVDWIRVIRLSASFMDQAVANNDSGFTRTPTSYAPCQSYLTNTTCTCSNTNLSSGFFAATSAQLAAITKDQTRTAHRMHQPFTVGEVDSYVLALAFNVKKLLKVTASNECGAFTDSAGYQIRMPFPPLVPVWYDKANTSSVVMKESYSLTGHAIANVTYRLDLYYVSTDADKLIHGVHFIDTFTSTTQGVPRNVHHLFSHTAHNSTYASFYNYAGTGVLFALKRRDDSSTVMQCTWCTSVANTTMTVTYNGASTVNN